MLPTSSCGKAPLKRLLPNGTGINKNMVIKKVHPVTTPRDSGLQNKYFIQDFDNTHNLTLFH